MKKSIRANSSNTAETKVVAEVVEPNPPHDNISQLAYTFWLERGRHDGCAEEDWLRAEQQLRGGGIRS